MHILYKMIRKERLRKGWSQQHLAELVGYTGKSMISQIERGVIDLPAKMVTRFAEAFGVTESYLMGWEEETQEEVPQYNPIIQDFIEILPKLTDEQANSLLNMARLFVSQNVEK